MTIYINFLINLITLSIFLKTFMYVYVVIKFGALKGKSPQGSSSA